MCLYRRATMSLMVGGHTWWGGGGGTPGGSGKSAVQLLQESKSQYVKSDLVLGTSQRPARPDRFHISSNPNIFLNAPSHTLHPTRLSPDPPRRTPAVEEPKASPSPITLGTLTPLALAEHANALNKINGVTPQPVRIQRGAPRPRAKTQPISDTFSRGGDLRRSLSHGPADRGNFTSGDDIQMKLRRLLDVGSKEKLCPDSPVKIAIGRPITNGEISSGTGTFRAEPAKVTVHKSLPDLWKTEPSNEISETVQKNNLEPDRRRPSCPSAISTEREKIEKPITKAKPSVKPPPVPPRKSRENLRPLPKPPKEPPEIPKRIAPRAPPPRLPPRSKPLNDCSNLPEQSVVDVIRRSSDSDASVAAGSDDMRRRPILRSKSDVTHQRCVLGEKDDDDEDQSSRTTINGEDLEKFFESMGLDMSTYNEVTSPVDETKPLYFDEKSSEDSIPRRGSSEDENQTQQSSLRSGEPSIVEKNARIIKWLFTCQRARGWLPQRSSTKSS